MKLSFPLVAVALLSTSACSSSTVTPTTDGGSSDAGTTGNDGGSGASDAGSAKTDLGSFTMECGTATKDFTFEAATTEVIQFDTTWKTSPTGDSVPDFIILTADDKEIPVAGNPLGDSPGLVDTTPKTTKLVHEFFTPSGKHKIRFRNAPPGCSPIVVTASYTRVAPIMTNVTRAAATALTKGQATSAHQGCTERWYKLTATAGEQLSVVLTGSRFDGVPADVTIPISMDLFDGTGSPVIVSGNPVNIQGELGNAGSQVKLDHTADIADTFFVKVTQSGCASVMKYDVKY